MKKALSTILLITSIYCNSFSQGSIIDTLFNSEDKGYGNLFGANHYIMESCLMQSGKILLGGYFTEINGETAPGLCLIDSIGARDTAFNLNSPQLNYAQFLDIAETSSGKIIGLGQLVDSSLSTFECTLCKFSSNGTLEACLYPQAGTTFINDIESQPNNKILLRGDFTQGDFGGLPNALSGIIRIDENGIWDTSFTPYINSNIFYYFSQPDGKILVSTNPSKIVRLNIDGTLDTSFVSNITIGNFQAKDINIQSDGKILVASSNVVLRLNTNGTIDNTFQQYNVSAREINIRPDGKIVFLDVSTPKKLVILNNTGIVDSIINLQYSGLPINSGPIGLTLLPHNRLFNFGVYSNIQGVQRERMAVLKMDGSIDVTFYAPGGVDGEIYASVKQPDGKVIIAGNFVAVNRIQRKNIARLNSNGEIDSTFNPQLGPDGLVSVVKMDPSGKIYIAGEFSEVNGVPRPYIARLSSTGIVDTSFNAGTGPNNKINSMVVQSNGKLIIVGDFTSVNSSSCLYISRLNNDGSVDGSYSNNVGSNCPIQQIEFMSTGKTIIRVDFPFAPDFNSPIAVVDLDGIVDTNFYYNTNQIGLFNSSFVDYLAVDANDNIWICSNSTIQNQNPYVQKLNPNGSIASLNNIFYNHPLDSGANAGIYKIIIEQSGKVILLGNFTQFNGGTHKGIVRINSNGSIDITSPFKIPNQNLFGLTSLIVNGNIHTAITDNSDNLIIGGSFTEVNGIGRNRLARLLTNNTISDNSEIDIITQNYWKIAPNPSNGQFDIEITDLVSKEIAACKITNILGEVIYETYDLHKRVNHINLKSSSLKGLYVVALFDNKNNYIGSKKIIIM